MEHIRKFLIDASFGEFPFDFQDILFRQPSYKIKLLIRSTKNEGMQ